MPYHLSVFLYTRTLALFVSIAFEMTLGIKNSSFMRFAVCKNFLYSVSKIPKISGVSPQRFMETGVSAGKATVFPSIAALPSESILVTSVIFFKYPFSVSHTPREKVAQFYRFVSSGCIACLQARLAQKQRPPVEQFADEMSEIILKGTRCLL